MGNWKEGEGMNGLGCDREKKVRKIEREGEDVDKTD